MSSSNSLVIKQGETPRGNLRDFTLPHFDEGGAAGASEKFVFEPLPEIGLSPSLTLAEAREKAEKVKKAAQKEAEALKERAFAEGFEQGLTEGRNEGRSAFEAEAAQALTALKNIENLYSDLLQANEAVLVKLVLAVSERVIFHEAGTSPETIGEALKAAVGQLHEQHDIVLRANPEDLAYLESISNEIKNQIEGLLKTRFEADPQLGRGDLVLETPTGRIDATLKRRFEAVSASVDRVLKQSFDLEW